MRILSLLLILSFNLFGIETVLKEYPELESFFQTKEIETLLNNYNVEIGSVPVIANQIHIITIVISVGNELTKKLVINPYFIDKELIAAEEFKFLFCRELNLIQNKGKLALPMLGLVVLEMATILTTIESMCRQEWKTALKKFLIGVTTQMLLGSILLKKARTAEYAADEFAIKTLKNKENALSVLLKKDYWKQSILSSSKLLNKLLEIISAQPTEKSRIEHINNI